MNLFKLKGKLNAISDNLDNKIISALHFMSKNRHCFLFGMLFCGVWAIPVARFNFIIGLIAFIVFSTIGTIWMYFECKND